MSHLLIVDDEPSICWGLQQLGESMGYSTETCSSAEQAFELVSKTLPNVIMLDVRLPGMDGLAAIEKLRATCGDVPIIVMTAYGDLETAVRAVREGAFDYVVKPFDLDKMQQTIERASAATPAPGESSSTAEPADQLIGSSPAFQEVFKQTALAAASQASVLLCGESGTGKELIARALHRFSDRSAGPFIPVHIASLSPSLAESELFGHVRGAFTGAEHDRTGLLEQADGGTLFLDEAADIPLSTQAKLLRVLEHGEITPVGGTTAVQSDFRIICASHQDLHERVQQGHFRHDLYFRLAAFRIDLPPLRERREDLQPLAEYFLHQCSAGKQQAFSAAALQELQRRPWYGNVRELRNAVEHAVIVSRGGTIEPDHLPPPAAPTADNQQTVPTSLRLEQLIGEWATAMLQQPAEENLYPQLMRMVERPLFAAALKHFGQCQAAAKKLGMHRTTLSKKMEELGLDND